MHGFELIATLTGGLAAALVFGFLAFRIGLSPIVGYLLAGVAVGPFTPGFVAHGDIANQLAEVGVILLLFGVGLQFHVEELLEVRKTAVPGALVGMTAAASAGFGIAYGLGLTPRDALAFGLALGPASTIVLLRVLGDAGLLHTRVGHVGVGWLVVEDIAAVFILVLLPLLRSQTSDPSALAALVGIALAKIVGLALLTAFVGRTVIPRILTYVARTHVRDLFTLTVLVLALGIAVFAATIFGASMALGAFLAGMVVGQSEFAARAASEALPMRDAFAVLFFVSIGMMLDPAAIAVSMPLVAATLAVVFFAKPLVGIVAMRLAHHPFATALPLGFALAQIGEFTFVVAQEARSLELLSERATQALVVTSILTITVSPFLVRGAESLGKTIDGRRPSTPVTEAQSRSRREGLRAIVVGYGPVGRTVTRILTRQRIVPTVIELNHETVKSLRAQGIDAIYGDASQRSILEAAGIVGATSLVFAASAPGIAEVVRLALELEPNLRVLARARYRADGEAARAAGAHVVVTGEVEVGLALAEHLLVDLGASPEQLDRSREALRAELGETAKATVLD